jgi:nicotinate-nucleotide adenylyltransferase
MNIAVYSGSFNPMHIGHLAIIRHLIEEAGFDMLYLIVSPKNPLKDGISAATGQDRYNAAVEAVNRHFTFREVSEAECGDDMPPPARGCLTVGKAGVIGASASETRPVGKVMVDDIELNMPAPHYTVRTLNALKDREPENTFTFVMGADNLADIRRWREYASILKDFGVAVFPRTGHDLTKIKQDLLNEDPAYRIQILEAELVNISSTQIREAIANGEDPSKYLM